MGHEQKSAKHLTPILLVIEKLFMSLCVLHDHECLSGITTFQNNPKKAKRQTCQVLCAFS